MTQSSYCKLFYACEISKSIYIPRRAPSFEEVPQVDPAALLLLPLQLQLHGSPPGPALQIPHPGQSPGCDTKPDARAELLDG